MIIIAYEILVKLGLKNQQVKINSLGIPASREEYKGKLKSYLLPHFEKLSIESKKRFETNVLRIFDSKEEQDQKLLIDAPLLIDHLDKESIEHFEKVKKALTLAGVPYLIDAKLVRGLDYYTNTTFEIASQSVGSQSALCGGGRYNLLIKELGGSDIPGVGFASGIERILLACENEKSLLIEDEKIDLYIVTIEKGLENFAFNTATEFRRKNLITDLDYLSRSVKAQMREANRVKAGFVLFIGGDEFAKGELVLKNMSNGEQLIFGKDELNKIYQIIKGV